MSGLPLTATILREKGGTAILARNGRGLAGSRKTGCLIACCVALTVAEGSVLQGLGFISALPLAAQSSALAPFGVFHDLRWAFTFAGDWWQAAGMLIGVVLVRSLIDGLLTLLAWPTDQPLPAALPLLRRTVLAAAFALILMSTWAAAAFAGAAIGFSPFLLLAMLGSAVTALFLPPAGVTGEYWRKFLPWRGMLFIGLQWFTLMLWALALTFCPSWLVVPTAAAAGVLNAMIWRGYVRRVVEARPARWTFPVAPVLATVLCVGLVISAAYGTTSAFEPSKAHHLSSTGHPVPGAPVVLYLAGFESSYRGPGTFSLFDDRVRTVHFSYKGVDPKGDPEPYAPAQTHQSLQRSASVLARQVAALTRNGRPLTILAESEGSLVARTYFAEFHHPRIHMFIQASPLIRPARVYFPPPGKDGYGLIGGWEAREMVQLGNLFGRSRLHADMPFIRSVVDNASLYRDNSLCPPRGVASYLYLPMEGALTAYRGTLSRIPWTTFPAYHAALTGRPRVLLDIERLIIDGTFHHNDGFGLAFQLIRGVSGTWQAPALPLANRKEWKAGRAADPAFGGSKCDG